MAIAEKDSRFIWHPYTQHKKNRQNIPIVKGKGAFLFSENGDRYLDAISSWWVNMHGHCHPYIAKKISEQTKTLEQVIFAGFTHPKAVELASRLLEILPSNQKKIFFSDDGSTAVEAALKMALQFWYNKTLPPALPDPSQKRKIKILALAGAYHGDTFGAMSVSGRSIFTQPFSPLLFDVIHIPFPEKSDDEAATLRFLKSAIKKHGGSVSSFIFEPLVQGAAGMKMYSPGILDKMISVCKKNNIITIADEVMTGFGRTGKMFASGYLSEKPDIICLSKGITGGFLPLGVTSCSTEIFNAFSDPGSPPKDKRNHKRETIYPTRTFFHGHSYTANPLACAAACANLDLFGKKETWKKIREIEKMHTDFKKEISNHLGILDIRALGTILAIEIKTPGQTSYLNEMRDSIYSFFISRKILLRPLGNLLYVMPPYCISKKDLKEIYSAIRKFLEKFALSR